MSSKDYIKHYFDEFIDFVTPSSKLPGGVYTPDQWSRKSSNADNKSRLSIHSDSSGITNLNSGRLSSKRNSLVPELLYSQQQRGSILSSNNADFRLGSLLMKLTYDMSSRVLNVHIIEGKNLSQIDNNVDCNPYLKISVSPSKFGHRKSKVHNKTNNPKFCEVISFNGIEERDLQGMTLNAKLYNKYTTSGEKPLGEINYSLKLLIESPVQNKKKSIQFEKKIMPIQIDNGFRGLLLLSLCLDLSKRRLVVSILTGKDLKTINRKEVLETYCILKLFTSKKTIGSNKTSIKYKTSSPYWNESFTFDVTDADLNDDIYLKVKVYGNDKVGHDIIGEIVLSSTSSEKESEHWMTMINNQRQAITEWQTLKAET